MQSPAHGSLSHTTLALIAAVLFLSQALCLLAIMPPWQIPDEPQHAELIEIFTRGTPAERQSRYSPRIEHDILQSMDRWDWWAHVGLNRPATLPPIFDAAPRLSDVTNQGVSAEVPVYHWIASRFVRLASRADLDARLYVARAVSLLAVTAAVFCMARTILLVLGGRRAAVLIALSLIVFHPQLAIVATGATPDGLAILITAVGLWIATACTLRGAPDARSFASVGALLAIGMLTKRTTLVLVYCVLSLAFLAFVRPSDVGSGSVGSGFSRTLRRPRLDGVRRRALVGLLVVAACAIAARLLFPGEWDRAMRKSVLSLARLQNLWSSDAWRDPAFLTGWFNGLFVSAWHVHGWVRYLMPLWWYHVFLVLTTGIAAGAVRALLAWRRAHMWRPPSRLCLRLRRGSPKRASRAEAAGGPGPTECATSVAGQPDMLGPVMRFATGAVIFQLLGIFGFYGLIGIYVQGRYLLPVLGMAALLLGYAVSWIPGRTRMAVAIVASAFMMIASLASLAAVAETYS